MVLVGGREGWGGGGGKGDSDGQFTISSNCGESGTYNHVASLWISDLFYMKLFSACEHVTVLKNILATIRSFHIMTSWSSSNKTEWSGCYTHIRLQCMCLSSSVETKKYFHESGVKFSTLYVRRKLIIPQLYYTWPFCQIDLFFDKVLFSKWSHLSVGSPFYLDDEMKTLFSFIHLTKTEIIIFN